MATGIPKTKWCGFDTATKPESSIKIISEMSLSYEGKQSIDDILSTKRANLCSIWNGEKSQNLMRLYFGDNFPILASLIDDRTIKNKVRLVYIDPPFATNSVFQSRAQNDAYSDILTGTKYIEFLRKRLILIREILAEDGSIYVHLDENMAFHIKIILDEIFGKANFRNWITRKKCNPKNYTRKTYGNISDYILFYSKTDKYIWNRPYEPWELERINKEYQYMDKDTGRRYKKVPIHAPGIRNGETGKPWRGVSPPPGKHWQYIPSKLDELDAKGEIYWSPNGNPRRKIFFEDSKGIPVQDIWLDFMDAHNQNVKITGYPTEKNPNMLTRIIESSSNPGDLILDCFSGSGTTLSVASLLDRNWIGIDNSKEAIVSTLRRFVNGVDRMGDFVSESNNKIEKSNVLTLFDCSIETSKSAPYNPLKKLMDKISIYASVPYKNDLDLIINELQGNN